MNLRDMPSLLEDDQTGGASSSSQRSRSAGDRIASLRNIINLAARSKAGVAFGLVLFGAIVLFAVGRMGDVVAENQPQWPRLRVMDAETGDLRWKRVSPGADFPYINPKTGQRSMYPVEYCFHNQCGPEGGTPVILNSHLGKEGPTQCPRCGEKVVAHNPRPPEYEGVKPDDWK